MNQTQSQQNQANNYCVYKHTTPSGKIYIGITGQEPHKRFQNGKGRTKTAYGYIWKYKEVV